MTAFVLQTALLMILAYLLGAVVAALVRQTFFAEAVRDESRPSSMWIPKSAEPVPTAVSAARDAAAPVATDARRFERALTGGAPAAVTPPAPVTMPAPAPVPSPVATVPVPRPAAAPAPGSPVASVAVPAVPAAAAKPLAAGLSAAAVAAATSAAATQRGVAQSSSPLTPEPGRLPSAAGSAGNSGVAAQVNVAPSAAAADDLTKIRGIDAATAKRLFDAGVLSYRQIAEVTSLTATNVGFLIHTAIRTLQERATQELRHAV